MSRFDKAAKAWVEKHCLEPGEIVEGSVTFDIDSAAYASSAWCPLRRELGPGAAVPHE